MAGYHFVPYARGDNFECRSHLKPHFRKTEKGNIWLWYETTNVNFLRHYQMIFNFRQGVCIQEHFV